MKIPKYLLALCPLLVSNCSTVVHTESLRMRDYALKYYEYQIMDNLVRAAEGKLILHVDITTMKADAKGSATGSVGGGRTTQRDTSVLGLISRGVSKPFSYGFGSGFEDSLAVTTEPNVQN